MYKVSAYGIQWPHKVDEIVDYINFPNTYQVLCFQTSALVLTPSGLEQLKPGDIYLYAPGQRVYNKTVSGSLKGFENDWVHFKTPPDINLFEQLGLPINQVIRTHNPYFIREYMNHINDEFMRNRVFMYESLSNELEAMVIAVARFYASRNDVPTIYDERLLALRQTLLRDYSKSWSVKEMAETMSLSTSHFSSLYKRMFHCSPNSDLLNIRIGAAKLQLRFTNTPIQQIAVDCGFQNEYYFSMIFKKRTGSPPSSYRSSHSGIQTIEGTSQELSHEANQGITEV